MAEFSKTTLYVGLDVHTDSITVAYAVDAPVNSSARPGAS